MFLTQLLRIMRITAILLLAVGLHVSANTVSQTITFSGKDVTLREVFTAVRDQTNFGIIYNKSWLGDSKPLTISAVNQPLKEFLEQVFATQPLEFSIEGKMVIVKKKRPITDGLNHQLYSPSLTAPPVTGIVRGPDGQPLGGVNVVVKGTAKGVSTNANGSFKIEANTGDVLVFSSIGYGAKEIKLNGENNIIVGLELSTSPLDVVQVIAYGKSSKRLQTGNITSVKAAEIEKQPVNNPLLALQGRVAGLQITQNTGVPGGGITVRIQGQNSLTRGNDPLYVIDGVPYSSQMLPNLNGADGILGTNGNTNSVYAPAGGGNPLSYLNPADIQSIEILKDADATSIYGSRAAAGAILITTKKGVAGKTTIGLNVQQGWGRVTRTLDVLNREQYLEMRHEAKANDNAEIEPTDYDINGTWDSARSTDWQKRLIGGTAYYTNAQASVSGGNTNTQFLMNAGYIRETSVFPGNLGDRKGSLHVNINHASINQRFRLQFSASYMADKNELINTDLTQIAIRLAPNAPALHHADGTLNWAQLPDGSSTWYNPLAFLLGQYDLQADNLIANAMLTYEIIPGLNLKSSFGFNKTQTDEVSTNPLAINAPDLRSVTPRSSRFSNGSIQSYIIEPQLTYKRHWGRGTIDFLLGSTFQQNSSNQQQFQATGFSSDLVLKDIRAASNVSVKQSLASSYRYNALFGRINYNWENKYILNVTARRDGSSRFGPENLFQNFGSVGGAWIISNEKFLQGHASVISFAKLRASYGTTGNDQIGDYQFMNLYGPVSVPVAYQEATGILPAGLFNPYLQWEETKKFQAGVDIGVLKDRILLNVNYYHNRSSNQLVSYELPYTAGLTSIQRNLPATVQNTGWELTLSTTNFSRKDFTWSTSVNVTLPKNKLMAYPDLENSGHANTYVIGEPVVDATKTLRFAGVDPATGLFTFRNKDGENTSQPVLPDDQTVLITRMPTLFGGFQNSFRYKGFELDLLFQFVKQLGYNYFLGVRPGSFSSRTDGLAPRANQPVSVLDRWQKPGDEKAYQRFSALYPDDLFNASIFASLSDVIYSDASFVRLKNLSLSWQIPNSWRQKLYLTDARLYVQGQNLLTITDYIGLDPESQSTISVPPLKVWTVGVKLSF